MCSAQTIYMHGEGYEQQAITRVVCTDDILLAPTFIFTPYYRKILETMNIDSLAALRAAYPVKTVDPALRFLLGHKEYLSKKSQRQLKKWGIILTIKNGKIVAEHNQPNGEEVNPMGERMLYNSCALNTKDGKRYIEAASKSGVESLPQDYHFMCCIGSIILNENTAEQASIIYGISLERIEETMFRVNKPTEMNQNAEVNDAQNAKMNNNQDASDDSDTKPKVRKRKFSRTYRDKRQRKNLKAQNNHSKEPSLDRKVTWAHDDPETTNEYKVVTSPVSENEDLESSHKLKVQESQELNQTQDQTAYNGSHCMQRDHLPFPIDVDFSWFETMEDTPCQSELTGTNVFMGNNYQGNYIPMGQNNYTMGYQPGPNVQNMPETKPQSINTPPSEYAGDMSTQWNDIVDVLQGLNFTNDPGWMQY